MYKIYHKDNLDFLSSCKDKFDLIYIDPPFNTGKTQKIAGREYNDDFESFEKFIFPRFVELHKCLKDTGSLFVHLDWREVHYAKVWLDKIFGRDNFRNEIIWAYDYGARQKTKWSTKHDNILWYTKSDVYTFNLDQVDRIPYMAPGLVGPTKAAHGKTPTDVWWHTIVPTQGEERVNYPTQKPLGILRWIVRVHSNENDLCLDCFAGSGSFGEACLRNKRHVVLVDENLQAIDIINKRLLKYEV